MELINLDASTHSAILNSLIARLIGDFMRSMQAQGRSMPQIHALMYIFHRGKCPVSELGTLGDSSSAAASQLAERLVRQGLVERTEDPSDRRTRLLRLTQKGHALIAASLPSGRFLEELLTSLSPGQRKTVLDAFRIIAEAAPQIHEFSPKDKPHA